MGDRRNMTAAMEQLKEEKKAAKNATLEAEDNRNESQYGERQRNGGALSATSRDDNKRMSLHDGGEGQRKQPKSEELQQAKKRRKRLKPIPGIESSPVSFLEGEMRWTDASTLLLIEAKHRRDWNVDEFALYLQEWREREKEEQVEEYEREDDDVNDDVDMEEIEEELGRDGMVSRTVVEDEDEDSKSLYNEAAEERTKKGEYYNRDKDIDDE